MQDSGRGGSEFAVMGGNLFGVVLAVAPVNRFVARQGAWVEFAFSTNTRFGRASLRFRLYILHMCGG
jgi:hypothetical protein